MPTPFCFLWFEYCLLIKCLWVMIPVFGWLSDKSQGKIITLLINNVVHSCILVLTLCFSVRETERASISYSLRCILHYEGMCEDLGQQLVQLTWCITENCNNCSALGIRITFFSSYTFSQFWQLKNPALDYLPARSCFSSIQWAFILNRLNQKNQVGYPVGTQTTVTMCATSRLQINQ